MCKYMLSEVKQAGHTHHVHHKYAEMIVNSLNKMLAIRIVDIRIDSIIFTNIFSFQSKHFLVFHFSFSPFKLCMFRKWTTNNFFICVQRKTKNKKMKKKPIHYQSYYLTQLRCSHLFCSIKNCNSIHTPNIQLILPILKKVRVFDNQNCSSACRS